MAREDDAKVVVRIDTRQAMQQLDELTKHGTKSAGRMQQTLRKGFRMALGSVGLGGGIGLGIAAVGGASQSSTGAIIGETFGSWGENLSRFLYGDLAPQAKAARTAREASVQAFAHQVGVTGEVTPNMIGYFNAIKSVETRKEMGTSKIRSMDEFYGPGLDDVLKRAVGALIEGLKSWFNSIREEWGL